MAKKNKEDNGLFVNPFQKGVTYQDLIDALKEGETVSEYLSGKEKSEGVLFTTQDIEWITNEVNAYIENTKNKDELLKKAHADFKKLQNANDEKIK